MLKFQFPDAKKIRVILDTDTACEADDPFAIAHALMSPKLMVKAIVAEHFGQSGSMEQSYQVAQRVVRAMGMDVPVYPGETGLGVHSGISEGTSAIILEARLADAHPLYLLCMGALTNAACALQAAPDIADQLTVVTIGGHSYDTAVPPWQEFNFGNDVEAANAVLQSRAPVWQIPANVYGSILVGLAELQEQVLPYGEIGRVLFEQMAAYNTTPQAVWTQGESWSLGDSPAVAAVLHLTCGRFIQRPICRVKDDTGYAPLPGGREIRVYQDMDSRYLLGDFFAKLHLMYPG